VFIRKSDDEFCKFANHRHMHSPYKEKFGIPRQPNLVQVESYIEMYEPYNDPLAFEGIEEFSHLWLIWQFHDNKHQQSLKNFVRKFAPRLGGNKKMGYLRP
jgi:tRNA (Thr-GGU) A37 N-methylase